MVGTLRFVPYGIQTPDMRFNLAASFARGLLSNFLYPPVRGRRESRVRAAPAVSCANCTRKNAHEHTGSAEASDFPCAVVYGLYVLSPAIRICLSPSSTLLSANLTPTLRRQDHTILPSAANAPVSRAAASTATHPYVRDVRETPLRVERDGNDIYLDLRILKIRIFFAEGLDGVLG
jgi:hypothetical protein